MSRELLERRTRRWRLVIVALSVSLTAVFLWVHLRQLSAPYRMLQRKTPYAAETRGIRTVHPCTGEPERCTTCHLNADRTNENADTPPGTVFKAHGPGIGVHNAQQMGCVVCHGGEGRALTKRVAHAAPGGETQDSRMRAPHVQASCAQCHVPGSVPGQERLLAGAKLYAGLGCPVCHPLSAAGGGGMDEGPDLRSIGRRTVRELETSLLDPASDFPGSTMPSFNLALGADPKALESLVIYLEGLSLPRQPNCAPRGIGLSHRPPCTHCHGGPGFAATGRMEHGCPYILERSESLDCGGCHTAAIPNSDGVCPVIEQHLGACAVCHRDSER
jgi:hypothetical protein